MTKIAKFPATTGHATRRPARRRRGHALLAAAAALLALGTLAAPASARPFQQYLNGACGPTICTINFAKVPAGQRMEISNTSCYVRLKDGALKLSPAIKAAQLLLLGINPNTVVTAVTMVPQQIGFHDGESAYSANHTITAFANAQQRFQAYVEINAGSFSQVACHISGNLVKA